MVDEILKQYKSNEIAKYIRLSLEDENKKGGLIDESESITNQRGILNNFITSHGNDGEKCLEFVDDGNSGTNFDRPGWKSLMDEVDKGNIKVIITKNLSRLGRSNFECGYYMDYFFPQNGIRYMTVQEGVDTANIYNSSNEYAPLTNFMNEKYSKDLSKNIKNSKRLKQKAGKYIGNSNALYGYKRDPLDKHHLVIDEYEASIVKIIFKKYLELKSKHALIKYLYDKKIETPSYHRNFKRKGENKYLWSDRTISAMLINPTYIGSLTQHKVAKESFRSKHFIKIKKEDWIVVPNTHEAIIDEETFNRVQCVIKENYRFKESKEKELLHGLFVCHKCHKKMTLQRKYHRNKDGSIKSIRRILLCRTYKKNTSLNLCMSQFIDYNDAEKEILSQLDNLADKYLDLINYDNIIENERKKIKGANDILLDNINKIKEKIALKEYKKEKLYNDRLNDVIDIEIYKKISNRIDDEIKSLNIELETASQEYSKFTTETRDNYEENIKLIKEYKEHRNNLTHNLLDQIIDRIEVHEDKTMDLFLKIKPIENIINK